MPDKITVTAKIGPALTDTTRVFNSPTKVNFDLVEQTLTIYLGSEIHTYDLNSVSTITYTIASHVATIAVS